MAMVMGRSSVLRPVRLRCDNCCHRCRATLERTRTCTRASSSSSKPLHSRDAGKEEDLVLDTYKEYGLSLTREEERESIRRVVKLLYAGTKLDDEIREAVRSGDIDEKALAVLHHKVNNVEDETQDEREDEDDDRSKEKRSTTQRALSALYDKILLEYQKKSVSPSMKLLSDALDIMLEEEDSSEDGDDETQKLLKVKRLLDDHFLSADLGYDPLTAAEYFAEAGRNEEVREAIDTYITGRIQKSVFVVEVEERLIAVEQEFQSIDRSDRESIAAAMRKGEKGGSVETWIEVKEQQNLYKTQKMQREKILKYLKYILELSKT